MCFNPESISRTPITPDNPQTGFQKKVPSASDSSGVAPELMPF